MTCKRKINPKNLRAMAVAVAIAWSVLVTVQVVLPWLGFFCNWSPSLPMGVYRRVEAVAPGRRMRPGEYVVIPKLHDNPVYDFAVADGFIAANASLLKKVVGVHGDVVDAHGAVVLIRHPDGSIEVIRRKPRTPDGKTLPVMDVSLALAPDECFVVGTHPASFDSRYFGPVKTSDIAWVCRPVVTW